MGWPRTITPKVEVAFGDGPFAASKTWTDISAYVLGIPTAKHGRDSELGAFQSGTMTVRLSNTDRRFDPSHAAGPYYGDLMPNVPVRANLVERTDDEGVVDSFDRADNPSSLGSADQGGTWTTVAFAATGVLGISSNQAYCSTTDPAGLAGVIDSGEADGYAQAVIDANGQSQVSLAFRGDIGSGSVWMVDIDVSSGASALQKLVSGVLTQVATTTGIDWGDPHLVRAEYVGDDIAVFIDGEQVMSTTDSALNTETEVGFVLNNTSSRIDDFESGTFVTTDWPVGYGYAKGWPQSYQGPEGSEVSVVCPDVFSVLANARIDGSPLQLEIAKDEPTHWYRLDEAEGASSFTDYGSDPVDGVPRGSANPGFGAAGLDAGSDATAWEADGTDAGYLDTRVGLGTGWDTVAFLFSHATQDNNAATRFFVVDRQRIIAMRSGVTAKGLVDFIQNGDSNTRRTTTRTDDGEPHLIVARRTGASAWSVYIDGAADSPTTASAGLFLNNPATTTMGGTPSIGDTFLDGTLQHVAFFDSDKTGRAAAYQAARGGWDGDLTGERIAGLLDAIGHPTGERDLDDGTITLGPSEPFTKASVLPVLQLLEATEQGKLYQEPDGTLVFHQRHAWVTAARSTTSQYTLSDDPTESLWYEGDLAFDYDIDQVINQAVVAWVDGTVIVRDQDSIDAYGPREQTITTLAPSASVARSIGEYVLSQYAQPILRASTVTLDAAAVAANWTPLLDLRVGDRVTVEKTPVGVGSQLVQESIVEAKALLLDQGQNVAKATLTLSPADTTAYALYDDAGSVYDTALYA